MNLVTRLAVPDDAVATATLWAAAWRAAYVDLLPATLLADLDVAKATTRHRERFKAQASTPALAAKQWVVEAEGAVVGLAGAGPGRDEDFVPLTELYSLNVHPDFWGTGAGHALHSRVLSELSDRGQDESYLWVLAGNARAQAFYERAGWMATEHIKTDPMAGDGAVQIQYRFVHRRSPAGR